MKRFLTLLGLTISVACGLFFTLSVAHHWDSVSSIQWDSAAWWSISLAAIMYIGTYGAASSAWNCSLSALGHPLPYLTVLRILSISQFAKYLPGNVGHHVGRIVLGKKAGLPMETTLGSMILDTLLVLAGAAVCSIWVLGLLQRIIRTHGETLTRSIEIASLAGVVIIVVAVILPISRRGLIRQVRHIRHLLKPRNVPLLGKALVAHIGSFLAGGTALYLLCFAVGHDAMNVAWSEVVSIYSAAWLLGFLIPGAPAGLGVRDAALFLGLGPIVGNEVATGAATLMRVVTTVGDGVVFMVGLALRKLNSSKPASVNQFS